jgi:hypothetical protein
MKSRKDLVFGSGISGSEVRTDLSECILILGYVRYAHAVSQYAHIKTRMRLRLTKTYSMVLHDSFNRPKLSRDN